MSRLDRIYIALLALWLTLFAAEAAAIARLGSRLGRLGVRLESAAEALDRQAREQLGALRQAQRLALDLEFLQGLPNLLPQDKGYLRTQKAISEEVQDLRRKLGLRLKGNLHVLIDAKTNKLYVKKGFKLLWQADCSVGRGGVLVDKKTGRRWEFVTPRGEFRVIGKAESPLWKKPDWAFVEAGEPVPPPEDPIRLVPGELGTYVLNLGDGYLIHGTKNEKLLGRPASHGCVRLGAEALDRIYKEVPAGTRVYVFY